MYIICSDITLQKVVMKFSNDDTLLKWISLNLQEVKR